MMEIELEIDLKSKVTSVDTSLIQRMLSRHPVFPEFVSGAKNGEVTHFHYLACKRVVAMIADGSVEFVRHFQSDSHWFEDVTYRVRKGISDLNRLLESMKVKPFFELVEGYAFLEELVPKDSRVDSKVAFTTLMDGVLM